mmetsp:Transcript_51469/g.115603  ORF Transcript_51469/g.115603 Transcript_51469/m.115603 type:complete len:210 (-) Transcript_51469:183-812(-)
MGIDGSAIGNGWAGPAGRASGGGGGTIDGSHLEASGCISPGWGALKVGSARLADDMAAPQPAPTPNEGEAIPSLAPEFIATAPPCCLSGGGGGAMAGSHAEASGLCSPGWGAEKGGSGGRSDTLEYVDSDPGLSGRSTQETGNSVAPLKDAAVSAGRVWSTRCALTFAFALGAAAPFFGAVDGRGGAADLLSGPEDVDGAASALGGFLG